MKIPGLRTLQLLPGKNLTEKVSTFGKVQLKNDINSILYSFKVLYQDLKVSTFDIEPSVMQKYGITEIGKTAKDGIRIIGRDFNHLISSPNPDVLKLTFLNKINGEAERIITIEDKSFFYEQTKQPRFEDFEETLGETLDYLNWKLIGLKNKATPAMPQPYIPNKSESEQLEKINRVISKPKSILTPVTDVFLKDEEMQLAKDIISKFSSIKKAFKNFNNDVTRHNVKTYYKNYNSSESSIKTFAFKNIGPNKENIAIASITHRGKDYLMIKAYDDKKATAFIISPEGTVQKNMPYEKVKTAFSHKRYDATPDFYTQAELDKSNLLEYLKCADNELKLFEEHTLNWHQKQIEFTKLHTNSNVGSTSEFTPKIKRVMNAIDKVKENLRKRFEYLSYSDEFRRNNNINIEFSRRGVKLLNATPEKYDIRVTFPSIKDKTATQILIMDGEKIKESYCILDEKLLRLDVKNPTNAFTHPDRQQYYHSQEYIDNSGLKKYLTLILQTLNKANKTITETP